MRHTRFLEVLRVMIDHMTRRYQYAAPVRYRVVANVVDRLVLQIVKSGTGWPDVLPITPYPGLPGAESVLTPGCIVLVQFIELDPAQPVVTHFSPKSDGAFLPISVAIDADALVSIGATATQVQLASGVLGAARQTDAVQAGPFGGIITGGSTRTRIG
jgi:hypothetical protein